MSSSITVSCLECHTPIDDPPNLTPEERTPCPKCGATARDVNVHVSSAVSVSTVATATVTHSPNVLMQAVVTLLGNSSEGDLIQAVAPPWFVIAKMIEENPSLIYQIDPRKWEELIAGWYKEYGFDEVILTPRSWDHGRDVIAVKRGILSVRVIDSVKRYAPDHRVPADDVRALLGVLAGDRQATKGIITTTSDFAPMISRDPFVAPFIPYRLELVNGEELRKRLRGMTKKAASAGAIV